jgi:hypothetical protein
VHERVQKYTNNLAGKAIGKIPLRRRQVYMENNIEVDLNAVECENVDCIYLTQDAIQCWVILNKGIALRASLNVGNIFKN